MQLRKPDITELLTDESFIRYCKQSSREDVIYWENYISQHPEQQEVIEIAKNRFLLLFNALAETDLREQEERLKNRLNRIAPIICMEEHIAKSSSRKRMFRVRMAAIASLLLITLTFTISHFINKKEKTLKTFVTAYGERKNIQLPDGSVVNLNAGSRIEIDESFDLSARDVYLTGEAFFDVKHNDKKPFIVHTVDMDVRALGTAFDVKAYKEEKLTQTSLIRGVVEVTLKKNNNKVLLYPSQKVIWEHSMSVIAGHESIAKKTRLNPPGNIVPEKIKFTEQGDVKEIAWKDNKLVFEDDSLEEIANMIERWYAVKIFFRNDEIRSYRFTGVFEKEDLKTVLNFLRESREFNFKIVNNENLTVYLSR